VKDYIAAIEAAGLQSTSDAGLFPEETVDEAAAHMGIIILKRIPKIFYTKTSSAKDDGTSQGKQALPLPPGGGRNSKKSVRAAMAGFLFRYYFYLRQ